jgi:cation transport protein ChaC
VLEYLRARELVTQVYKERILPVLLSDRRQIAAVGYVVDRAHVQYAGALDVAEAAAIVREAIGKSGPNPAYVINTVAHLRQMGIRDHWLESVERLVAER